VVSEFLVTLDFERGGDIAPQLSAIYTFLLAELLEVGMRRDAVLLERLTGIVQELRDGFAGAAMQLAAERQRA
jgi:flagellar protein FliS